MNPTTDLIEFPEVSARMERVIAQLEALAKGGHAADNILRTGEIIPRLWDITSIHDPELRLDTWHWLEAFVRWFNSQHTWFSADQIPPCWPEHPPLVREVGTLADQRRTAGESATSTALDEWHRYTVPPFLERTRTARATCEEKHMSWPGRPAAIRHTTKIARELYHQRIIDDIGSDQVSGPAP